MNRQIIAVIGLLGLLNTSLLVAQGAAPAGTTVLGTVKITQQVLANGKPLPPGTYEVRLTDEKLAASPGQSPDSERGVEFVANGMVVGRDMAVVMSGADVAGTVAAQPSRQGIRVDLLKGGDFVRVSAYRAGTRYLIHLPVQH